MGTTLQKTERAHTSAPNRSTTPTDKEWKALGVKPEFLRKLWKPTEDPPLPRYIPILKDRPKTLSPLKGGAIFLGFLCMFLGTTAGIAHWRTGFLGVAKSPSQGIARVVTNGGFQTFYYEAGDEVWIEYSTKIEEGFFNVSIWTSDKLFSRNIIEKVFEYQITHSHKDEITWTIPQSRYYRIVFSSGIDNRPDLFGTLDRKYSAQYGINRQATDRPSPPDSTKNPHDEGASPHIAD